MARLLALCSLPRTNPGRRRQYKRVNGPYTLIMSATGTVRLPYGNLPRLLLAWVSTEAVRSPAAGAILGRSLSEFMRAVGIFNDSGAMRRRLRTQMDRLFHSAVSLSYEDEHGKQSASSLVADRVEFWWNPKRPQEAVLWDSKIRLGEDFFNEIIRHPLPLDMNILKALKRSTLGLDLYMWLAYRTFTLKEPLSLRWREPLPPVRGAPLKGDRLEGRGQLRTKALRELKKIEEAWSGLNYELARGTLILGPQRPRSRLKIDRSRPPSTGSVTFPRTNGKSSLLFKSLITSSSSGPDVETDGGESGSREGHSWRRQQKGSPGGKSLISILLLSSLGARGSLCSVRRCEESHASS